ncbi:chloride channel protein [Actinospica durhamensis]|uniref:Chloride channel protein n=1 Tax=Actinospica durhamensis TaxID=1508375 RepID=A0A941EHR8_9ACTN|nr:chloride channel protein [Actinospica durhamensis]MBR7831707.1 chloride channel protein [Actinospica durhamensis]
MIPAAATRAPGAAPRERPAHLGDFDVDPRVVPITGLALLVGGAGALASFLLLRLIGLITNLVFFQRVSTALVAPGSGRHDPLLVLCAPIAGGLVVGLMARFGSEKIRGHGMPEAIEAILTGGSRVAPRVAILKPISAAVSIGSGGPFGAEGPIIMTGGAVGSILAQALNLTADERKTLLVSGAAAGMAATFNAPLASVLLAVELLLFEWRPRSLIPVGAAVTVSVVCRGWLLGTAPVFPVATLVHPGPAAVTLALIPGVTGGLLAIGATGLVYLFEDAFGRLPIHWMWWPAIGGLVIGVGGLFEPSALGVGYDVIDRLLTGRAGLSLILGILIVKTLIWSFSLGSGTSGGVLAPVFMIGGALGALEGDLLPHVFPGFWAMAGLAAVVGGVMRSPLTGIVFTLELTHAWNDLVPLLVASVSAYLLSVLLLKRSVLTEKIARRGLHLTREYSTDPLEIFFAREVMTTNPVTLRADDPLEQVLRARVPVTTEPRREPALYPVIDAYGALTGILTHRELLAAGTERSPATARTVGDLARPARTVIHADQTLREVVNAFALHSTTRAPVVDRADPTRLLGVVTLTQLLHARREDHREEHHRQRHLLARPGVEPPREQLPLPVTVVAAASATASAAATTTVTSEGS